MALDHADRVVQAVRGDYRIAARADPGGPIGDAVAGDDLRWPQRGTRVDHAVAYACHPRLKRGHHLLPRLGRGRRAAAAMVGDQERWHRYLRSANELPGKNASRPGGSSRGLTRAAPSLAGM